MNKVFEKIIDELKQESIIVDDDAGHRAVEIIEQIAEEYNGGWIPIKTRPMTEEKKYYSEYLFEGNGLIYECPLPEDGQEVLVTSKYGSVDKTTFYTDCGNYFENYEDYDEVIAWQPLPEPFKERD